MRALRPVGLWAAMLLCSLPLHAQKIAVLADHVYTMDSGAQGGPGIILINNGKIEAVRTRANEKPPAAYEVYRAAYATPGLIDTDTTAGISGAYNIPHDQDEDETTDPNTADVRSLDSFNPSELLVTYINQFGVTTIQSAPGPKNPIAGRAGIFKTRGPQSAPATADQLAMRAESAMIFNLGDNPKTTYGSAHKPPMTRMKTAEMIRHALSDAQAYQQKWDNWKNEKSDPQKQPARDMRLEALLPVVNGTLPAVFTAQRSDDIITAIRIASEFHLKYMLASVTEGYLVRDAIHSAGVPCLVGPIMQRLESQQTANATYEIAALLEQAGIPIAMMSGYEAYVPKNRVLLFEAGIAAANGLGMEKALRAATIDAATILGIQDRVGSLSAGKDADVVLFDGDPFEYTSHVLGVFVNGQLSYQRK
jgi:imidazolonepropionase-like amidohydrolase